MRPNIHIWQICLYKTT